MATVQTIATTLTADPRPFTRGVNVAKGSTEEFGKAFARLDAQTKRAGLSGGLANDLTRVGGASSNASRGVLELSRGIEDFSTQFGTQGFAGGIRAASNNLSQMAMMLGGPVAGAVAGFAAAGLTMAMPYIEGLFNATEQAKRFSEQLDILIQKEKERRELRTKEAEDSIDFREERKGLTTSKDAESAARKREIELEKNAARLREIEESRVRNRPRMSPDMTPLEREAFEEKSPEEQQRLMEGWAKADQLDFQLANERMKLLQKERDLRIEIGQLKSDGAKLEKKEIEAQRTKDAVEFAAGIRKMQEEDDRMREKELKDELRDNERVQGLLNSRMSGLGGKTDPLEGLNLPEGMRNRVGGLLERIESLGSGRSSTTANAVTANSQSLARAQAAAKEAAKASQERQRLLSELQAILRELKEQGKRTQDDIEDFNIT